jgi:hypothetical protein
MRSPPRRSRGSSRSSRSRVRPSRATTVARARRSPRDLSGSAPSDRRTASRRRRAGPRQRRHARTCAASSERDPQRVDPEARQRLGEALDGLGALLLEHEGHVRRAAEHQRQGAGRGQGVEIGVRARLALEPLDRGAVALDPRLRAGRALAAEAVADDARTRPAARRLASAPACANTPVQRAGLRQSAGPASRLAPTRRSGPTICLVLASPGAYRLLPTNAVVRDGAVAITGSGVGAAALCSNSRATAARLGSGSNAVAIRVTTPHATM